MRWRIIIKYFGPNIQHIYGVDIVLDDTLIRLSYKYVDNYEPRTMKAQCRVNDLFATGRAENNGDYFPLYLLNI